MKCVLLCCVLVINTSCPRTFAEDIWWSRASFGKVAVEDCPFGSTGWHLTIPLFRPFDFKQNVLGFEIEQER